MLHVGRKPILENIIENFIEYGFNKFYLSVNFKSQKIIDYFGDGSKWGIAITYLHEDKRLGTAGGLSLIEETLDSPIIVTNADIITALNYDELMEYHNSMSSVATMCTREFEYNIPYGVVDINQQKISALKEKPSYTYNVNAGIYVLEPHVLEMVPKNTFFDMPTLFEKLVENNLATYAFNVKDYWIDVGHISDYHKANEDLNGIEIF
jgi:NDP-sugar pyrophosphorylase family protein